MKRELVVFVLFLLMNVALSVNCFFPFSITLASVARDVSRENETLFKNFILVWDKGDTISTFHWNILFWRTLQIIGFYLDILINKAVFSH